VTGNGNASKLQVQRAVQHFFSLECTPHPPDVADALAVALCYVNGMRFGRGEKRNSKSVNTRRVSSFDFRVSS
jgi:Holliday junction resolvasome RuvABC endonuclease subunit